MNDKMEVYVVELGDYGYHDPVAIVKADNPDTVADIINGAMLKKGYRVQWCSIEDERMGFLMTKPKERHGAYEWGGSGSLSFEVFPFYDSKNELIYFNDGGC